MFLNKLVICRSEKIKTNSINVFGECSVYDDVKVRNVI